jgi:hypothetical protein
MRFKGTWILLIVCLALGGYLYFYEIKGGEKREKAKEAEKQLWKVESKTIQLIELRSADDRTTVERKGDNEWAITHPRPLEADTGELNRLADSAAEMKIESVLEENPAGVSKYGLDPAKSGLKIRTQDAKEYEVLFGDKNPAGNSVYARMTNRKGIFLISSAVSSPFDKKLDDLRSHSILRFEPAAVRTLTLKNRKGTVSLVKDGDDRWWIEGDGKIAANSPDIRGILNALSLGRIPEFFDDNPGDYVNLGLDNPLYDVSLTYGDDKALKHLSIGFTQSALRRKGGAASSNQKSAAASGAQASDIYLAKDASRQDLFFVTKDLVDKLDKSAGELRDKALASFQSWNVDVIILMNPHGRFSFTKSGGEWFIGEERKKADFESVNGILEVLGKDIIELVEKPAAISAYGLDQPVIRVVLKQGAKVLVDCSMGKETAKGVFAQVKGDPSVKIADRESFEKLGKAESAFVEKTVDPKAESPAQGK